MVLCWKLYILPVLQVTIKRIQISQRLLGAQVCCM